MALAVAGSAGENEPTLPPEIKQTLSRWGRAESSRGFSSICTDQEDEQAIPGGKKCLEFTPCPRTKIRGAGSGDPQVQVILWAGPVLCQLYLIKAGHKTTI